MSIKKKFTVTKDGKRIKKYIEEKPLIHTPCRTKDDDYHFI